MNTASSTSMGSKEEAIHAKTRGLQAEFRQQRDKAHHAYQVASEKLQTSLQNAQDIQKVVQDKQERLANIEESKQELQKKMSIGHKVAGLKKEADFQHSEVVSKRQTMKQSETVLKAACANRQNETRHIAKLAKQRRQRRGENEKYLLKTPPKDALQREIMSSPDNDDEMMILIGNLSLDDWILFAKTKTEWYKNGTELIKQKNIPTLQNIIERYPRAFDIKFDTPAAGAGVVPEETMSTTPRRRGGGKPSDVEEHDD